MDEAKRQIDLAKEQNIEIITYDEPGYPSLLKHCIDSPVVLYKKGNSDLNSNRIISIVGTRNATSYGRLMCETIIEGLIDHQPIIVSGLAYGIDISAHRAALKNDLKTIAVLGHGFDHLYPELHRKDARNIKDHGALLTEFPMGGRFDKENFPKRNRIIAGISEATIVIESAEKGGAIITCELANSYDREVMALPGDINKPWSAGCNQLIKKQIAGILTRAEDIVTYLGWADENRSAIRQQTLFAQLSEEESLALSILQRRGVIMLEAIEQELDVPLGAASTILLELECKGFIEALPGNRYQLLRASKHRRNWT